MIVAERSESDETKPLHLADAVLWLAKTITRLTLTSATPSERREEIPAEAQRANARRIVLEYLQGDLRHVRRLWERLDKEAPEFYNYDELTDIIPLLQEDDELRRRAIARLSKLKL